jgi:hypothetical protein
MAVAGHLFTVTELNGCFDLPDTDKFVPIVPSSVETMLVHPKSLTITFIAGRKTRNSFTLPSIPSPAVRLVVSTSAHLYSDVLLSKVFSILFEKKNSSSERSDDASQSGNRNIVYPRSAWFSAQEWTDGRSSILADF